MTREELALWVEAFHYPQLVLATNDVVKPGKPAWDVLLSDTNGRIDQALARIQGFLERVEREKRLQLLRKGK